MKFENPFSKSPKPKNESIDAGRRNFMKGATNIVVSGVVGASVGTGIASLIKEGVKISNGKTLDDYRRDTTEFFNEAKLREKIFDLRVEIRSRYDISVLLDFVDLSNTSASAESVEELRLTKQIEALETLQTELSKYPDFIISQYGLEQIVITTRSRNHDKREHGGYITLGNIDATLSIEKPELVLFYDWNNGHDVPEDFRIKKDTSSPQVYQSSDLEERRQLSMRENFSGVVHHELAHMFIDVPGSENSPRLEESKLISDWEQDFSNFNRHMRMLCEPEARYIANDGKEKLSFARVHKRPPGFARGYGLTDQLEDRATIIEELMKPYGQMQIESYKDDILDDKIALIKKYYLEASSGLMNDEYWEVINRINKKDEAQGFLIIQTERIIKTPYEESPYRSQVGEGIYKQWQDKLKTTKIAKDFNLVN